MVANMKPVAFRVVIANERWHKIIRFYKFNGALNWRAGRRVGCRRIVGGAAEDGIQRVKSGGTGPFDDWLLIVGNGSGSVRQRENVAFVADDDIGAATQWVQR